MSKELRKNKNIVFNCTYHIVFCPKRRSKVLVGEIREHFKNIVVEVGVETQTEILEVEVMPDHVHLCVSVDPQFGVHKFVKRLKGRTSRYLRKEYDQLLSLPSLWTNSYYVGTVGNVSKTTVLEYIKNQWQK